MKVLFESADGRTVVRLDLEARVIEAEVPGDRLGTIEVVDGDPPVVRLQLSFEPDASGSVADPSVTVSR